MIFTKNAMSLTKFDSKLQKKRHMLQTNKLFHTDAGSNPIYDNLLYYLAIFINIILFQKLNYYEVVIQFMKIIYKNVLVIILNITMMCDIIFNQNLFFLKIIGYHWLLDITNKKYSFNKIRFKACILSFYVKI